MAPAFSLGPIELLILAIVALFIIGPTLVIAILLYARRSEVYTQVRELRAENQRLREELDQLKR